VKLNTPQEYELIIPSQLERIKEVEDFTEKVALKTTMLADERDSLAIVVTELVNNAIVHANKKDESKKVEIRYVISAQELLISVLDEGTGFDPNQLDDPRDPENLLKDCGRGIFIVRSLMDEVKFETSESGMKITIIKKLQ